MTTVALAVMIAAAIIAVVTLAAPARTRERRRPHLRRRRSGGRVMPPTWNWDWASESDAARRHGPYSTVVLGGRDTTGSETSALSGTRNDPGARPRPQPNWRPTQPPARRPAPRPPVPSPARPPATPPPSPPPRRPARLSVAPPVPGGDLAGTSSVVPPPARLARRYQPPPSSPPPLPPLPPSPRPIGRSRWRRNAEPLTWPHPSLHAGGDSGESRSRFGAHTPVVPQAPRNARRQGRDGPARSAWIRFCGSVGVLLIAALGFRTGRPFNLAFPVGGTATLLVVQLARRRTKRRQRQALTEAAPAAIDLLSACLLAGLNPHLGILRVAERCPDALRAEFGRVAVDLDLGRSPAAAMRAAAERTGLDELRAAAAALEAAERWGMAPAEALAARAKALRSRARLAAEADAGRAAVRLAFPLVICFLPAFVLLTVLPAMAGALHALVS